MKTRLIASALLAAGLFATGTAMAADAPHAAPQNLKTARALFAVADHDKDGQVTREEARGRLPLTYANFERIDTAKRGSVSFEQFLAFTQERAAKQADEVLKIGQRH